MTQDQIERCDALWRELMDAGNVWWVEGMATRHEWRAVLAIANRCLAVQHSGGMAVWRTADDCLPDWEDPATIGCLVALMREATDDAEATCVVYGGRWHCDWHGNESIAETEPEALLRAIKEAAR